MLRRAVLSLACAISVCGAVVAAPPGLQPRPHVEGRELDPVARDHFLSEPPAVVNVGSAPAPSESISVWVVMLGVPEAVMSTFTMPLGTARLADM